MSDIFLSYASEDRPRAKLLSDALRTLGWNVWWDRTVLPGKTFDKVIEDELSSATCVIVLWSGTSVESNWVRAEAGEALNMDRLIPALLDDVTIPLVFRQIQAASLADWEGDTDHAGFQQLVRAVTAHVPPSTIEETAQAPSAQPPEVMVPQAPANEPDDQHTTTPDQTRARSALLWWLSVPAVLLSAGVLIWFTLQPDSASTPAPAAQKPDLPVVATVPPDRSIDTQVTAKKDLQDETKKASPALNPESPATDEKPVVAVNKKTVTNTKPKPTRPAEPAAKILTPKTPPATVPVTSPPKISTPKSPNVDISAVAPVIPAPVKPPPLSVAIVAWGMPKDDGIADPKLTTAYSVNLAETMAEITKEYIPSPTEITYVYPGERNHYALMRDRGDYEESMGVCNDTGADIAIFGFVEGSEFDDIIGWLVERKPFFAVFDCKARTHVSRRYDIYGKFDDSFPYKSGLTKAFRQFARQEGDLARYAMQ